MLTKETVIDKTEVLEDGTIQVREATYIVEDGVRILGPRYHRYVLRPGEDTSAATRRVQAVAAVVWTPDVVAAEQARKDAAQRAGQIAPVKA